jgi:hypothetical protein
MSSSPFVPSTNVGFLHVETDLSKSVEISLDPKETFGIVTNVLEKHQEDEHSGKFKSDYDDKYRKKRDDKLILEKKIIRMVQDQLGSPTDSPKTESGPWTDTGVSSLEATGTDKPRSKKFILEFPEPTTDSEIDYSEFSPSPLTHDAAIESVPSSNDKEHPGNDPSRKPNETLCHQMPLCDVQLSPILFQDTKATSPMGVKGVSSTMRQTADASSSPPLNLTHSASTSPPKKEDLEFYEDTHLSTTQKVSLEQKSQDFKLDLNKTFEFELQKNNVAITEVFLRSDMGSDLDFIPEFCVDGSESQRRNEIPNLLDSISDTELEESLSEILDRNLQVVTFEVSQDIGKLEHDNRKVKELRNQFEGGQTHFSEQKNLSSITGQESLPKSENTAGESYIENLELCTDKEHDCASKREISEGVIVSRIIDEEEGPDNRDNNIEHGLFVMKESTGTQYSENSELKLTIIDNLSRQEGEDLVKNNMSEEIENENCSTSMEIVAEISPMSEKHFVEEVGNSNEDSCSASYLETYFVIINIRRARNLKNCDYYAVLEHGESCYRTKTVTNTTEPEWNHEIIIHSRDVSPFPLSLYLYHEDVSQLDHLGSAVISFDDVIMSKGKKEEWIELTDGNCGEILISVEYCCLFESDDGENNLNVRYKRFSESSNKNITDDIFEKASDGIQNTNIDSQSLDEQERLASCSLTNRNTEKIRELVQKTADKTEKEERSADFTSEETKFEESLDVVKVGTVEKILKEIEEKSLIDNSQEIFLIKKSSEGEYTNDVEGQEFFPEDQSANEKTERVQDVAIRLQEGNGKATLLYHETFNIDVEKSYSKVSDVCAKPHDMDIKGHSKSLQEEFNQNLEINIHATDVYITESQRNAKADDGTGKEDCKSTFLGFAGVTPALKEKGEEDLSFFDNIIQDECRSSLIVEEEQINEVEVENCVIQIEVGERLEEGKEESTLLYHETANIEENKLDYNFTNVFTNSGVVDNKHDEFCDGNQLRSLGEDCDQNVVMHFEAINVDLTDSNKNINAEEEQEVCRTTPLVCTGVTTTIKELREDEISSIGNVVLYNLSSSLLVEGEQISRVEIETDITHFEVGEILEVRNEESTLLYDKASSICEREPNFSVIDAFTKSEDVDIKVNKLCDLNESVVLGEECEQNHKMNIEAKIVDLTDSNKNINAEEGKEDCRSSHLLLTGVTPTRELGEEKFSCTENMLEDECSKGIIVEGAQISSREIKNYSVSIEERLFVEDSPEYIAESRFGDEVLEKMEFASTSSAVVEKVNKTIAEYRPESELIEQLSSNVLLENVDIDSLVVKETELDTDSENSPTVDDLVYREYPHLSQPVLNTVDNEIINLSLLHYCKFQNITSLRSHFVDSFKYTDFDETINNDAVNICYEPMCKKEDLSKFDVEYRNICSEVVQDDTAATDNVDSGLEILSSLGPVKSMKICPVISGIVSDNENNSGSFLGNSFQEKTTGKPSTIVDDEVENISHPVDVLETLGSLGQTPFDIIGMSDVSMKSVEDGHENFNEPDDNFEFLVNPLIKIAVLWDKTFWESDNTVSEKESPASSKFERVPVHSMDYESSVQMSPTFSPDSTSKSSPSYIKSMSPNGSLQSVPSSPLKVSGSIKKYFTSESFSSGNDISQSLDIVYMQPEVDPKEQLKAQYSTVSMGSVQEKIMDRRKASFTQLKRPSLQEPDLELDKKDQETKQFDSSGLQYDMPKAKSADFLPYISNFDPPTSKKLPSPTKIINPVIMSSSACQQSKEETFSPVFEIHSKTPLRSPEKKFEYLEGKSWHLLLDWVVFMHACFFMLYLHCCYWLL